MTLEELEFAAALDRLSDASRTAPAIRFDRGGRLLAVTPCRLVIPRKDGAFETIDYNFPGNGPARGDKIVIHDHDPKEYWVSLKTWRTDEDVAILFLRLFPIE